MLKDLWKETLRESPEDVLVLKLLLVFLLNLPLIHFDFLKDVPSVVLFNIGIALVWFALYLKRVRKIYERNLKWLPTISKSIPEGDPIRIENEIEKRRAMQSAIRCQEWESFNW